MLYNKNDKRDYEKKEGLIMFLKSVLSKMIDSIYVKKGYHKGYGMSWLRSAVQEYKTSSLTSKEKRWALNRGFYPWRIAQYGLNDENYINCLSDRDYKFLFPMNTKYSMWIDNKLTMKYILKPFDEHMSKYYFHLLKERNCHVMRLMDCPMKYSADYEGILRLLEEKQVLAGKPSGGTYGIGFCKFEYKDGKYYVNNEEKNRVKMIEFFHSLKDYIIIEYIIMHQEIGRLNPGSLNTIRVMLINEDGNNPYIASSFMRIGTKQSGIVDNTAQGGMFCKVDVKTGKFYDGEKIDNHVISPSPKHPDTGELIEGVIPNWELVKEKLIEIASYMPQLEWMGFDVAITQDGFNIIEINSHQGLHRYHTYPQDVKSYFMRKLKEKKEKNKT